MSSLPPELPILPSVAAHCAISTVIAVSAPACLIDLNDAITQGEHALVQNAAAGVSLGSRIAAAAVPTLAISNGEA